MKIIAEVGSNWKTFEHCTQSISQAKMCGADVVKFQLYNHKALYGIDGDVMPGELPIEWLPKLKGKADAFGIEFMCSAFSPELIDAVDPYVSTHKVASAELTHVRILQKLNDLGKPVILSTGASGIGDIGNALSILSNVEVTLLYCVAEYPARLVNLLTIPHMREAYGRDVGFSDHTTDILMIPKMAKDFGATVIEKHVNFIDGLSSADSPHSLTAEEFKWMCNSIKLNEYQPVKETEMRSTHNRRLIATEKILPGDMLIEGKNFGIYRAQKPNFDALSPWATDIVNGSIAKEILNPGDGVTLKSINELFQTSL